LRLTQAKSGYQKSNFFCITNISLHDDDAGWKLFILHILSILFIVF